MKLTELQPTLLRAVNNDNKAQVWEREKGLTIAEADGIVFLCPKCLDRTVAHSIMCWTPKVPADFKPGPGRWNLTGTDLQDVTFKGVKSDSVQTSGCGAHFFVRNGEIEFA